MNSSPERSLDPFRLSRSIKKDQLPLVLDALERMHAHLTAAVVSNDPIFIQASPFCHHHQLINLFFSDDNDITKWVQEVIGNSVNGTTYAGLRGRTTGAPQNIIYFWSSSKYNIFLEYCYNLLKSRSFN